MFEKKRQPFEMLSFSPLTYFQLDATSNFRAVLQQLDALRRLCRAAMAIMRLRGDYYLRFCLACLRAELILAGTRDLFDDLKVQGFDGVC